MARVLDSQHMELPPLFDSKIKFYAPDLYQPWKAEWISYMPGGAGRAIAVFTYLRMQGEKLCLMPVSLRNGKGTLLVELDDGSLYRQPVRVVGDGRETGFFYCFAYGVDEWEIMLEPTLEVPDVALHWHDFSRIAWETPEEVWSTMATTADREVLTDRDRRALIDIAAAAHYRAVCRSYLAALAWSQKSYGVRQALWVVVEEDGLDRHVDPDCITNLWRLPDLEEMNDER